MSDDYAFHHASKDLQDVLDADVLVAFTDDWCRNYLVEWDHTLLRSSGGRHVEMGVALGDGKSVIVLGAYENIFQRGLCLQEYDIEGVLRTLRPMSAS